MSTVVGFIGRLSPEKDPDACYRLAEAMPSVQVVMVGDGPLKSAMMAGAPANLHVVGPDHDHGSVIAACDMIIVPSLYESFGLTIAEAAWLGVPCLSTSVGIAAIHPGLTRTIPISAPGSVLAAAVAADLADTAGTATRVANSKSWVQTNLTTDRMGRQYCSMLATLAPTVMATRITGILNGTILKSVRAPLDPSRIWFEVENCGFASGQCGWEGFPPRDCSNPHRPDKVMRDYCYRCKAGELDDAG